MLRRARPVGLPAAVAVGCLFHRTYALSGEPSVACRRRHSAAVRRSRPGAAQRLSSSTKKPGSSADSMESIVAPPTSAAFAPRNGLLARLRQLGHDDPAMPGCGLAHDQAPAFEIGRGWPHGLRQSRTPREPTRHSRFAVAGDASRRRSVGAVMPAGESASRRCRKRCCVIFRVVTNPVDALRGADFRRDISGPLH